jgi:hypothetical protein
LPRGFKRSIPDTEAAGFCDRRSFRSIDGHDLLAGRDKQQRHDDIQYRDRSTCQICKHLALDGEWRHLENEHNQFRRCDCMEGGEWAHHNCHFNSDHKGPMWTKRGPKGKHG